MPSGALRTASYVELAVVLMIFGAIAIVTIPQRGRAADRVEQEPLRGHLEVLRSAIERYCYDHVAWPGQFADGRHPALTEEAFITQLTQYTDREGVASDTKTQRFCFGPYLRAGVPACPVAPRAGCSGICVLGADEIPRFHESAISAGWVYNPFTGDIALNSDHTDDAGRRYDER